MTAAATLPGWAAEAMLEGDSGLGSAHGRWFAVCERLSLGAAEQLVGWLLLASELHPGVHAELKGEGRQALPCQRADLLRHAAPTVDDDVALQALATLERRGVIARWPGHEGNWLLAPVSLAEAVRDECTGARRSDPLETALEWPPRLTHELGLARAALEHARGALIVIRGRRGSGRDSVLATLLANAGRDHFTQTPEDLRSASNPLEPELSGRVPVWDARNFDVTPSDRSRATRFFGADGDLAVAIVDADQDLPDPGERELRFADPDPVDRTERRWLWTRALGDHSDSDTIAALMASRCRAGAGLIHRASASIDAADVASAVTGLGRALERLVQPSAVRGVIVEHPETSLSRLIVPERVSSSLSHLRALMRHGDRAASSGRFGAKGLFCGPPGTGKTMAARALACATRAPLVRVDLASVVSKWIGETEKNLRRALEAAELIGGVLLFDEGEALFGKRGDVDRGSDRYANMEVSYLLQAMEAFDGAVIVTTNAGSQIDRAFLRRFDVHIEFPIPEPNLRARLWAQELAEAGSHVPAPLLAGLAEVSLSGGHIAAAARLARVLALDAGRDQPNERELMTALVFELRKVGSRTEASRWEQRAREAL